MPFSSIIAYFTNNPVFKTLAQEQKEALVRMLAYAQAIDGEVVDAERDMLAKLTKGLNWQGGYGLEEFVVMAVKEGYTVMDNPVKRQENLGTIGRILGTDKLREEAYFMAAKVAVSDGVLRESEQAFLKEVVTGFGIPAARLSEITEQLIRENVF